MENTFDHIISNAFSKEMAQKLASGVVNLYWALRAEDLEHKEALDLLETIIRSNRD